MKRSTRNILLGSGIAVAGVAAVVGIAHHYTTKYLMKLALDREGPKSATKDKDKLMSSSDLSETVAAIMDAAKKLEETEHEQIEITAQDGTTLVGHWFCPENAKRIIIAMHGWRSTWSQDFGAIAPFWFDNDCAVLFAEQRGQGNSGGEYMGFGLLERYDCLDWINWVNERTEQKYPVYLAGVSMGASTVLMTAGLDLPENVKGVIADCGYTSAYDIWKHVVKDNMKLSYGLRGLMIDRICQKKINTNSKGITTLTAMQKTQIPILFIHGTDDKFVPVRMTYENYKACNAPKELLIVPGAIHGQSYDVEQEKYEAATRRFWNMYK